MVKAKGRTKAKTTTRRRTLRSGRSRPSTAVESPTAVAAEAMRTGVIQSRMSQSRGSIPREDEMIRVGDPDDDSMANEYVGDETPGGSASTPDQNMVDDIGRVYGLQEEDAGDLHCAAEILERRDHRRAELRPPKKKRY
jgi:hypothetical protein